MNLRDVNLQVNEKDSFHTSSLMYFAFIFSEYTRLLFPKRLWKCESTISLRKYKWKVVIYLFYNDSSKSFFFMLNMAFDVLLSTVSCNIKITRTSRWVFWYVFFYKNLIVLQHGYNNFLFYFDICIKFILLTKISTMKKSHLMRVMKQQ